MAARIIEAYNEASYADQRARAEARRTLQGCGLRLANEVLSGQNPRALAVVERQIIVNEQLDLLAEKADELAGRGEKYCDLYRRMNSCLKEAGDLVNFMGKVEGMLEEILAGRRRQAKE